MYADSEQRFPQQPQLPSPESSQQSGPSVQSKSVSWSVDPPEIRRSVLKPGSGYDYGALSAGNAGYGYWPSDIGTGTAESRAVVNAGSVVAFAAGAGYGHGLASDQGVG